MDFDVIIIGAGPGGYVAAIKAAQLGLKTACVEKRATLGGTCLNVGCIPSKALLQSSEKYHEATHDLAKHGVGVSGVKLDLGAMLARKDKVVDDLTKGIAFLFKKNGVTHLSGAATLKDKNTVEVAGKSYTAKNIVIASGSDSTGLPGVTVDEQVIVSSTGALSLPKVPAKLVVIGGGYIGLELGAVWARLGSAVTVVEYAPRILPAMDEDLAAAMQKILEKQGFAFKTATKVVKVERKGAGASVTVEPAAGGKAETLDADVVLLSIGRKPHTEGLNLAGVGVALDEKGRIKTDDHWQTTVPGIYAIGDVIAGPMLAHKAEEEGVAVAELLAGQKPHINYDAIPGVVYTQPEIATVGKSEAELKAAGVAYKIGKFPFLANSRAKAAGDTDGFVKILTDAKTDRILGAHIIGSMAGTMIAELALAMEFKASAEDVARTCHAHPTHNEAVKEAALAAFGKAIHA
ncbi:MAG: dihydrolipoyl dehydrogenase [Alphaproteobacteria bacterium]|jgi:dihydrolipoamide dehydrogenase|nr:dihydrolipoyl dehydrogenase [Alphaproteobacteria bacterium]